MATIEHPKVGELRPSQLMFTFGVGAIVDLPYLSALVMGIDDWPADPGIAEEIHEDRLLQTVRWELGHQVQRLLSPPVVPESAGMPNPFDELARIGVPVALFPRWMHCPQCNRLLRLSSGLLERKDNPFHPERTHYVHSNCDAGRISKPPFVIPARFLVACENGHLDDFPWVEFVHQGPTNCNAILRLIERGPTGEARDLEVRCDTCGAERRLADAFGQRGRANMPRCRGRRPHLRDYDDEECEYTARTILLGASNLWFPDVLTAVAIPAESARLAQLIEEQWATFKHVTTREVLSFMRNSGQLTDFHGYPEDEIWQAIQHKREVEAAEDESADPADLKGPEWEMLTHPDAAPSTEDFRLREVAAPAGFEGVLEHVVLAERLREVRALIGFTRIDAPGEFGDEAYAGRERRMRLSRQDPAWVPAADVRGEGIFIEFSEDAIQGWLARSAVKQRSAEFFDSHMRWRMARYIHPPEDNYPGLRYVLLHSFAHALMRQLVLECGYTAASVRERIYSRNPNEIDGHPDPMAGVLIYTAAPDSEGTLGGLVSLGEPDELRRHIAAALRDAQLCASDPLCAEHLPSQRGITLHAAACHACMFAPETSCERGNKYLDRSVLVPTVERAELAFFGEEG